MRFGVDLGGTKIEAVVMDHDNRIIWQERRPTPADTYPLILGEIGAMLAAAENEINSTLPVGIGMPGSLSPATGLVRNANTQCLNGKAILNDLQIQLGRRIWIANDANCFALSEACDGAGTGANSVFGVILGTGCGGGLVINKRLHEGANAIGGEWGHNPLPARLPEETRGPACYCGRTGCNETWISGPGFAADHYRQTGDQLTPVQIAASGDPSCRDSVERLCDRIARALAVVINIVDPEIIVLGGGLSNLDILYTRVPELWPNYIFSDVITTRLVKNQHGDASGVRGAAWLCEIEN
jgi:fructokinase